jgi:DNA-binding winged helix-turn-helix (wHTH) protein
VKAANNPEAMAAMYTNAHSEPVLWGESSVPHPAISSSSVGAEAVLKFGRFRLLSRRRRLLAEGVPVELGSRAFDLLLILLEADGTLVRKKELLNRVWPNVVVSEENLKVQISALRKALGADRNLIRTEFGLGYRFTGILRSNATADACRGAKRAKRRVSRALLRRNCRQSLQCGLSSS